jgi:uncharacterized membrane protein
VRNLGDPVRLRNYHAARRFSFYPDVPIFSVMNATADPVFLDAILRPNPPMSVGALRVVLAVVAAANLAFAIGFMLRGAWPIAPFMGLDVALLAWALRASRLAAQAYEHIRVTSAELFVDVHPARGPAREVTLNPYWVTVHLDQPDERARKLTLRSHGKQLQVGSFLDPGSRLSFAGVLRNALERARRWDAPPLQQ